MKILIVHNRYRSEFPSGEDRVVDTESAALEAAGHTVMHFEKRSDDIAGWSAARRATLPLTLLGSRSSRNEIADVLRKDRPDVVHVHNTFPLLTASILGACDGERVPVVATIHNYKLACASGDFFRAEAVCHDCSGHIGLPGIAHGCYRGSPLTTIPVVAGMAAGRKAWKTLPSAYIFISDSQRRALSGLDLPLHRSFVKWNLVPRLPGSAAKDDGGLVVYLGRLDPAKGLPVLMDGWDLFHQQRDGAGNRSKVRLSIAGNGPLMPAVQKWAQGRSDVDVLGVLDRQGCGELLARARAVVVPSAWEETFGLVVVEAMAAGVPVVAADHGSLPELVTDGVNGVVFRPGDPRSLAGALQDVAASPDRWRALGAAARKTYESQWDPDVNLRELEKIYRFAIDNPVWKTSASHS
jgi:glycosyltransferase involved in cell wall biosynthesis